MDDDSPYYIGPKDIMAELRRQSERQAEVAHAEQLAEIRARSRALVWTGTEAELIEAIRKFYESGWLAATDLQDALRLASLHFVRANGTAVIKPYDVEISVAQTNSPIQQSKPEKELIERRQALLAEYKAATGNPSNQKIYGAKNSGLHKPQFYEWKNGKLSVDSVTAKNFERFLAEKKLPIPRERKR
jgi:hypothetical protein